MKKNSVYILGFFIVLILIASCSEECKTVLKYKLPIEKTFKIGDKHPAFKGYSLELNSIEFVKVLSGEENPKDSIIKAESANFYLFDGYDSSKVKFRIQKGKELGFGNSSSGAEFRHFKILCNDINVNDTTAKLLIYDSNYMVDCSDWE